MNKNPFSIYDFMGYFFPGVICIIILYSFFLLNGDFTKLTDVKIMKDILQNSKMRFDIERSVLYVVISYVLGHIVSYVSSLTIEQFAIKVFDYPSTYLLKGRPKVYSQLWRDFFRSQTCSSNKFFKCVKITLKFVLKSLLIVAIFPVSVTVYTLGYLFDLNGWIVRPLDKYLIDSIKIKQYRLANRLQINHPDVNDNNCDYHRIIQHYVYLNIPHSQKKADNYIALYGFLRCMSLIFSLAFDVIGIYSISTIDLKSSVDWQLCGLLFSLYFMAYLTFLGFMKFYRRYTLENYMTLLSGMFDVDNNGDCVNQ